MPSIKEAALAGACPPVTRSSLENSLQTFSGMLSISQGATSPDLSRGNISV